MNGTGFCLPEHFYFGKDVYNGNMVRRKREIDMLHGPLIKGILLFAMPLMLSNLLQIGLNAADTIIVGKFSGQHALAAVGATGSIINLVVSLFNGIAIGANILIASLIGKGFKRKCLKPDHFCTISLPDKRKPVSCLFLFFRT